MTGVGTAMARQGTGSAQARVRIEEYVEPSANPAAARQRMAAPQLPLPAPPLGPHPCRPFLGRLRLPAQLHRCPAEEDQGRTM